MIDSKPLLVHSIISAIDDLKGEQINLIDLREVDHAVCDWMIVCHGNSSTHVQAIAHNVEKESKINAQTPALGYEGRNSADWILLDFFDVIVHVFSQEKRAFYDLESVWGDAPQQIITPQEEEK